MHVSSTTVITLNRSEQASLAAEGPLGPINIVYLMRFDRPIDTALMRQALWDLMMAFPRLRALLCPGWLTYQLDVLDDEFLLRSLFDTAYRERDQPALNTQAECEAAQTAAINIPLSLQRDLPWRAEFDARPAQPVLLLTVHHIMADGTSMAHLTQALLARLQGQTIPPCPIEPSSQMPGLLPRRLRQWPESVWAWWQASRRDARQARDTHIVRLQTRHCPRFSPIRVHHAELPCTLPQFKAAAKAAHTTLNTLLVACLAQTFLAPHRDDPRAVAVLRIAVDLRKYFPDGQAPRMGNHVVNLVVHARHRASLADQIRSIHEQITDHLGRFERHENTLPNVIQAALPFIGLRLVSKFLQALRASGGLSKTTAFITNVGSVDMLQPQGDGPRLTDLRPVSVGPSFFIAVSTLGERVSLVLSHQQADFDQTTIDGFLDLLGQQIQSLVP